jgi:hypothetical protein
MAKFFNKPQLSGTQLQQAQQSNETGVDAAANNKARQADRNVDQLLSIGQGAIGIAGKYQENIEAKDRLESRAQMPFYKQLIEEELSKTENFESLGREGLNSKFDEINEIFMERYKDKPYNSQLRQDIEGQRQAVLTGMITQRDGMHVKKVADHTAQNAADFASLFSSGSMDEDGMRESLTQLMQESTLAHQVPSSSELDLSDEAREKYRSLTSEQARDAVLRGMMIHTGQPANSKVAQLLASDEFRGRMGIGDADEDYNKMVAHAYKKGVKADKLVYDTGLDNFKEKLYGVTNMGIPVNIDMELEGFKKSGQQITAQDEHKLRKAFKTENRGIDSANMYRAKIADGVDTSIGMTPKDKEAMLQRVFTDELNMSGSEFSIDQVNAQLNTPEGYQSFKNYAKDGGELPKSVSSLFNLPAGSDVNKWVIAEDTLVTMQAAMSGSGKSVDELIGVDKVARVRAFSNMLSDKTLSEQDKREQRILLSNSFANINSRGFIRPMKDSTLDMEDITDRAKDADNTTDTLSGYRQNQEIITHYAALNELSGMDSDSAIEKAIKQFDMGHTEFELPDGAEIAIPVEHKLLNPVGIKMFAKGNADIADRIKKDNFSFASDFRVDRQISMRKAPDFNRSKEYILTYDEKPVSGGRFTYEQYNEYIGTLPRDKQLEVDKNKHKTRQEKIDESYELGVKRKKAAEAAGKVRTDFTKFNLRFM